MKIVIIGAGPAGLFTAYQLEKYNLDITILEQGNKERFCPSIENKTKCINCKSCSIMEGLGGAGSASDFKFPITNDFGGTLYKYIGENEAINLMWEINRINENLFYKLFPNIKYPKIFSSENTKYKKLCTQNNLHLLDSKFIHLGSDYGKKIYKEFYNQLKNSIDFQFNSKVQSVIDDNGKYWVNYYKNDKTVSILADIVIIAAGRSGSKWVNKVCDTLNIKTINNKVDIGIRFECLNDVWKDITDELYESKIIYKTKTYEDLVRTFCMNPSGSVVTEKTNGLITVNGHSYEDQSLKTKNTNFALLVSKNFTEPFKDSNGYGEAIVSLSNMLSGGVIVQRLGDLIRGKRTTNSRLKDNTVIPTLKTEPGDLSLVLPKRILDDILEMIEKLNCIVPGMINDDNLLYGVELKKYNSLVQIDNNLQAKKNLYIIGDCSGVTHSLSQASASGLFVGKNILKQIF